MANEVHLNRAAIHKGDLSFGGPVRFDDRGYLPRRFGLKYIAGAQGKPGINADATNASEAVQCIANKEFELLGTNALTADGAYYNAGGITLGSHGADGDQTILCPHLATGMSAWTAVLWDTAQSPSWECDIQTASAITSMTIWAGLKLTNTPTTATDDDQCFFRFTPATNGGRWQALYSIANTDTAVDSGIAVAASTRYHLKIEIDSTRAARMYIAAGSSAPILVATSTPLTSLTTLIPYIGVAATGAAAVKTIRVHSAAISRLIA